MSLLRPDAVLELTGNTQPGPLSMAQAGAARVRVDLSVDEAHDRVELVLWPGSLLAAAQPGDTLRVGLGTRDRADVLTVDVIGVERTESAAVLVGLASSQRLSHTWVATTYRDQSLGDVISSLLAEADVEAGDIEAGPQLPVVLIDPRRSVWAAVHYLAGSVGFEVSSEPNGAVRVAAAPGAAGSGGGLAAAASAVATVVGLTDDSSLRTGANVLRFTETSRTSHTSVGAGAVHLGAGSKARLWSANPDSGGSTIVALQPLLATRAAAETATTARAAAARRRSLQQRITVVGDATLRAGGTTQLDGTSLHVVRARHLLDAHGYRCDLVLEGLG